MMKPMNVIKSAIPINQSFRWRDCRVKSKISAASPRTMSIFIINYSTKNLFIAPLFIPFLLLKECVHRLNAISAPIAFKKVILPFLQFQSTTFVSFSGAARTFISNLSIADESRTFSFLLGIVFHNAVKRNKKANIINAVNQSYGSDMVFNTHSGSYTIIAPAGSLLPAPTVGVVHSNDNPLIRLFKFARLSGLHRNVAQRLSDLKAKIATPVKERRRFMPPTRSFTTSTFQALQDSLQNCIYLSRGYTI